MNKQQVTISSLLFLIFILATFLALNFAKDKDINFPLIFDKDSVLFLSNAVGGISGVPATFIYNKDNKKRFLGLTPKSVIEKEF